MNAWPDPSIVRETRPRGEAARLAHELRQGAGMKLVPLVSLAALLAAPGALAQGAADGAQGAAPAPPGAAVSTCVLVEHHGVDPNDAQTASRLVCSEILQAGPPAGSRYRVSLGTLGSLVIVSVDREGDAPGRIADSRSMTLHGIEEVRIAAPRLAEAIVHGAPIAETQTVDNLVSEEARVAPSRPGRMQFAVGLAGAFTPFAEGLGVAPAVILDLHYGMSQIEIGGSLRFGFGSSSGATSTPTGNLVAASIGGRYFTTNKDISPYFGGGLAYSYFSLNLPDGFDGNSSGLGAYIDAGVEILRTHHAHLALGARLDLPFFALGDQSSASPVASGQTGVQTNPPSSLYFAPLSLEARLTF